MTNYPMTLFRPGPNNTIIIVIIVNGTNVPNISLPNILNITIQPIPSMSRRMNARMKRYERIF